MRDMIGALDQRISLQRYSEVSDGAGGITKSWVPFPRVPTVWAKVTPRVGTERLEEGRVNAQQMATFTIRYRDDVSETDRIIWRGETWNVRRVMRQSQREMFLQVDAERGVTQ